MAVYTSFKDVPSYVSPNASVEGVNRESRKIRSQCMKVTRDLIEELRLIGDSRTIEPLTRGLMIVAASAPLNVVAVGLYPYEQDILPPLATALAYDPRSCLGPTPSVQVLAQSMAMIAHKKMLMRVKTIGKGINVTIPSVTELTRRFVMMLRSSYLCCAAGVAFVNVVPVHTSNFAQKVKCGSHFVEWLAKIIEIHSRAERKMSVIAMGAFSNQYVSQMMTSFKSLRTWMTKTAIANPASVSYTALDVPESQCPVDAAPTEFEIELAMMFGTTIELQRKYEYAWKDYPTTVIEEYTGKQALDSLTVALLDKTVDSLRPDFSIIMDDHFSNTAMTSMSTTVVEQSARAGGRPVGEGHDHQRPSAPVSQPRAAPSVAMQTMAAPSRGPVEPLQPDRAPVPVVHMTPIGSEPERPAHGQQFRQDGGRQGFPRYEYENVPAHPSMEEEQVVRETSIIGALAKRTGKAPTQPVIIISQLLSDSTKIREENKSLARLVEGVARLIENLMAKHDLEDDELEAAMNKFKQMFIRVSESMDESVAIMAQFVKNLDGEIGTIETEIQPAAPIIDHKDGSTIRDLVYSRMRVDKSTNNIKTQSGQSGAGGHATALEYLPAIPDTTGMIDAIPHTSRASRPGPTQVVSEAVDRHRDESVASAARTNVSIMSTMSHVDSPIEELADILEMINELDESLVAYLVDAPSTVTNGAIDMDAVTLLSNLMIEYRDTVSSTRELPIEATSELLKSLVPFVKDDVDQLITIMEDVAGDPQQVKQFFDE